MQASDFWGKSIDYSKDTVCNTSYDLKPHDNNAYNLLSDKRDSSLYSNYNSDDYLRPSQTKSFYNDSRISSVMDETRNAAFGGYTPNPSATLTNSYTQDIWKTTNEITYNTYSTYNSINDTDRTLASLGLVSSGAEDAQKVGSAIRVIKDRGGHLLSTPTYSRNIVYLYNGDYLACQIAKDDLCRAYNLPLDAIETLDLVEAINGRGRMKDICVKYKKESPKKELPQPTRDERSFSNYSQPTRDERSFSNYSQSTCDDRYSTDTDDSYRSTSTEGDCSFKTPYSAKFPPLVSVSQEERYTKADIVKVVQSAVFSDGKFKRTFEQDAYSTHLISKKSVHVANNGETTYLLTTYYKDGSKQEVLNFPYGGKRLEQERQYHSDGTYIQSEVCSPGLTKENPNHKAAGVVLDTTKNVAKFVAGGVVGGAVGAGMKVAGGYGTYKTLKNQQKMVANGVKDVVTKNLVKNHLSHPESEPLYPTRHGNGWLGTKSEGLIRWKNAMI